VRVLLFAGKGGVGKTTIAAATAVAAARRGIKTLVLSTDRAHSLTDVLGQAETARGVAHEVEPGLSVLQVDPTVQLARAWATVRRYLVELLDRLGVAELEAADLLSLAGADDVLDLLCLREQVESGPWDLVVVDAAASGETLRLLAVPDSLVRAVDRVWSPGRRLGLQRTRPEPAVAAAMARLRDELAAVRSLVLAPTTSVRLVLVPEAVGLAEARRTFTALTVQGVAVDAVVANRVVPADGDDPWRTSWAAAQARLLAEADESFAPLTVQRLPYLSEEPVGAEALDLLGSTLLEPADDPDGAGGSSAVERLLGAVATAGPQVRRTDQGYQLVLPAPLASAREIGLTRDGDDLRLEVQGTHRVVALPPVLRRCIATSAVVTGGSLVVEFVPDPRSWPQGSESPTSTTHGRQR
jgi:arsenite-transporting ATPase